MNETGVVRHRLTESQQRKVAELRNQIATLQNTLNWFLAYVVEEAALPADGATYRLAEDGQYLERVNGD